ncbi:hypothetical protein LNP17_11935 [Klebsiella variicola subsp. variicola]|nr:hypothetical protein [Klebsiella variicola subsp. variicola]
MTRLVMSVAAGAGNLQDAAKFASEELNDQSVSMAISTAAASGGVLIPQNLHSEVIEATERPNHRPQAGCPSRSAA